MSDFATDFLWEDVSRDNAAIAHRTAMVHSKVAVAQYWPYLANSVSERDFDHKLSVVAERIKAATGPDTYDEVVESLRNDFRTLHEASVVEAGRHQDTYEAGESIPTPFLRVFQDHKGRHRVEHVSDPMTVQTVHSGSDADEAMAMAHELGSKHNLPVYQNGTRQHKTATNYQPDPTAGWRYHPGYENLNGPVDNGALMDSDGFVKDLAQGEDRANAVIEQRQLTPGTWTAHDGMPERPMPQGVARGYQPVAAKGGLSCLSCGKPMAPYSQQAHCKDCAALPKAERDAKQRERWGGNSKESSFDKEGFLVEAFEGRGVDPLVDPAPGTPQRVNPYYFNTEEAGMGANDSFPQNPSADLEPKSNWMNEFYGEGAQPQVSSGSDMGTVDGDGYSRANPGESPNFSQRAAVRGAEDDWSAPRSSHEADQDEGWLSEQNRRRNQGRTPEEIQEGLKRVLDKTSGSDQKHEPPAWYPHNWRDWQNQPDVDPYSSELIHRDAKPSEFNKPLDNREASTDGKIVGHCPGCDKPLREHKTAGGRVELHHLHNDHVRCFGDRTSKLSNGSIRTADYLGRPDANNPTGRGPDEFRARTWDGYNTTRPMQSVEDRNINGPVLPERPTHSGPNINSPVKGMETTRQDDDDEDDEE